MLLPIAAFAIQAAAANSSFDELAAEATKARQENRLPQAIELYRSALGVNPSWPEGWWFLGRLSYDVDQYREAKEAFTRYVALKDQDGAGWGFLGLCEFETGQYSDSLEHLRHAFSAGIGAQLEVQDVLHFHMALLLTRLGLFDQAVVEYSRFVQRGTKNPVLVAGLGLAALRRPLLPQEIPANQKDVVTNAGEIAYVWAAGNATQADTDFSSLLTKFPDSPGVHYFRGSFLLGSHPQEAIAELEQELTINPSCADARAIIALAMMRSIDDATALPQAQRAAADGPATPMAQYVYGLILTHLGDEHGIGYLETAEKLDPKNFECHIALAGAYSKFGRYADARRERAESIALAKETTPVSP